MNMLMLMFMFKYEYGKNCHRTEVSENLLKKKIMIYNRKKTHPLNIDLVSIICNLWISSDSFQIYLQNLNH